MLGRTRNGSGAPLHSGLYFDDRGAAVARLGSGRRLSGSYAVHESSQEVLAETIVREIRPASADAELTSALPFGSYQLLLVDLPDLPRDELPEAVKWQIRELLDYPAEEAVVELFDVPALSRSGQKTSAYAVATRRDVLQRHIDAIHESGLKPAAIDIPELCLRNVAAMFPQDNDGVALLCFGESKGLLTLTRQGQLYFIRSFDVGTQSLLHGSDSLSVDLLSSVVLEVQRSLDYYESHYDRRPVTEILLAPGIELPNLTSQLREQLGLNVNRLDLGEVFELEADIAPEFQSEYLVAVGAALRNAPLPSTGRLQ
jgi:MSHA biogenesis protein MshI